jgi:hypothetical protein
MRMRVGRRLGVLVVKPLGQSVIFGESFFTAVPVTAAVGTRFRLKWFIALFDARSQPNQHVPQYRVRFKTEVVSPNLDGRVPVSQVVGSPGESQVIRGGYHQNCLRRGFHADEAPIVGLQQGAGTEHGAAWQQDGKFSAIIEGNELACFPALIVRKFYHVCRYRAGRHRGQHGVGSEHLSSTSIQNRK